MRSLANKSCILQSSIHSPLFDMKCVFLHSFLTICSHHNGSLTKTVVVNNDVIDLFLCYKRGGTKLLRASNVVEEKALSVCDSKMGFRFSALYWLGVGEAFACTGSPCDLDQRLMSLVCGCVELKACYRLYFSAFNPFSILTYLILCVCVCLGPHSHFRFGIFHAFT